MSSHGEDPDQAPLVTNETSEEPEPACKSLGRDTGHRWVDKTWDIAQRMRITPCSRCWPEGDPSHEPDDTVVIRTGSSNKTYHKPVPDWEGDD